MSQCNLKETSLVTLAGATNSHSLTELRLKDHPTLLGVGTRLSAEVIADRAADIGVKDHYLVVESENCRLLGVKALSRYRILEVGITNGPIETLARAIDYIETDWIIINPITTVPSLTTLEPAIYFGNKPCMQESWSSVVIDETERQPTFVFKSSPEKHRKSYPFTGVICAKTSHVRAALASKKDLDNQDLLSLAAILFAYKQVRLDFAEWLDIGHVATYGRTRLSLISSRFFNSVYYNELTGSIIKYSSNATKLRNEAEYYQRAALPIKRYFPRVYASKPGPEAGSWEIEIEHLPGKSLAEIFLYGNYSPSEILLIVDRLFDVFSQIYSGKPICKGSNGWLYEKKLVERKEMLEQYCQLHPSGIIRQAWDNSTIVNNAMEVPPLKDLFRQAEESLSIIGSESEFYYGHGDLCFNNIMVEPTYGYIRLIDPKSSVDPQNELLGLADAKYDLAKLYHSSECLYDAIVNNLFRLVKEGNHYSFYVFMPNTGSLLQDEINKRILQQLSANELAAITTSLFLSMIPLHNESEERMLSFAFIACALLQGLPISRFHLS